MAFFFLAGRRFGAKWPPVKITTRSEIVVRLPKKIEVFLQADLLSGPPRKINFRRWTVSSTPIYIFLDGYLASRVISA